MSNELTPHPILDAINEGVFTVDLHRRITGFNRAAERITGVRRKEAMGRPCFEVFRADICETDCAVARTLKTGQPVINAAARIYTAGGHWVPIRISTALLRDADARIIGAVETFQDLTRIEQLEKKLEARYSFEDLIGRSPAMQSLFELLPRVAGSESTVLISGESGTGKELVARAIHNLSHRRKGPFVAINCGALPDTLLESELFGYKAGAFTDARKDKIGRFVAAQGGTLFLDEIGDVTPAMQVRLLRAVQERSVEPLGDVDSTPVDVRLVAATNKDLKALVRQGDFREDLYYRIRVVELRLPPLRERREDIPLLAAHFIARLNRLQGKEVAGVSNAVLMRLMEHDYPGNVRELENILEHAFVLCQQGRIDIDHLPPELRPAGTAETTPAGPMTLKAMERLMITEALRRHGGNRQQVAAELGIDPSTLYRKIRALKIASPTVDGRGRRFKPV
ncbi:MAG: sigma 54-interacting transcriptional regulator [Desulfobacterales bacterium]|jgi:PAS domain S-box-containing protein|nr:sigma 54-interacting transcriptional regulator [Desulfobacteraceae bacterium]MDD3992262.1 sigma 54-interacting transcriptional regulator [Desulfobacteraceae bacterium]MDY0311767.1 sigma 54-interacting transcriptional regulator [Desulfobacterales bacterium]